MPDRIYIETTFVSYLTARPYQDPVVAGHQIISHEWWDKRRHDFDLCISQLVLTEAAAGDSQAANDRLQLLKSMTLLETTVESLELAKELIRTGALPVKAANDALHIAVAAASDIPYLLTWNCRHLANAAMRPTIDAICSARGLKAPITCTPEELLGD